MTQTLERATEPEAPSPGRPPAASRRTRIRLVPYLLILPALTVLAVVLHYALSLDPESWGGGVPELPGSPFAAPDFGLLFQVDLFGAWTTAGPTTAGVILFTLVLAGFFDALGTILAIGTKADIADENGQMPREIGRAHV